MTRGAIEARRNREVSVYEAALRIREVLDQTREAYGPEAFDADDVESVILELVTEEDPS